MRIPFEKEYRKRYYQLLDEVFDSNFWSEGPILRRFEDEFGDFVRLPSRAVSNAGTGLWSIFEYLDVKGYDVVIPSNTFWATAVAAKRAGANVIYADCNKFDLCLSLEDLKKRITPNTKAVTVVHIGGHIAFEIEEIAEFCKKKGIYLIEDCAHVHGGWWNGKTGGHYGFAGAYSFYATKTMPLGDGGMVVSKDLDFLSWLEKFRNYGKDVINGQVTYPVKNGFNLRMNNFTAALGIAQLEHLPKIFEFKNELAFKFDRIFNNHVKFPDGMTSGYYKYIVFEEPDLAEVTGQVFGPNDLCHVIDGEEVELPNSEWIVHHHQCPPVYYGWDGAGLKLESMKDRLYGKGA